MKVFCLELPAYSKLLQFQKCRHHFKSATITERITLQYFLQIYQSKHIINYKNALNHLILNITSIRLH